MDITMFVTETAMQFNFKPVSEHEKEMLKILKKYTGKVTINSGIDIGMTQGNYTRNFGERSDIVAITINQAEPTQGGN